jgi:hypothetical protein
MEGFEEEARGGQTRRAPAAFKSQKNFGSRLAERPRNLVRVAAARLFRRDANGIFGKS